MATSGRQIRRIPVVAPHVARVERECPLQVPQRCAPVMRALDRAGVPPREAAIVFASLLRTGQQVAVRGGKASALPAGVLRDNALLLEQNDPELRKLSNPGADS